MKINAKREIEKCVYFIRNVFEYKKFNNAVIGVSGGLDSAVITYLCVKALGKECVHGFMLPYGEQHDMKDAISIFENLKLNPKIIINIKKKVDTFGVSISDKIGLGNIKARIRMIILYDMSRRLNALVVGTSNKTELELGYFTLHGDGACALEPIGHLYKTQVREIAKELKIPKKIIKKCPSAGLWISQKDEDELGCSYNLIDKILYAYNSSPKIDYEEYGDEKITMIAHKLRIPISVVDKIIKRKHANKFKTELPIMLGGNIC